MSTSIYMVCEDPEVHKMIKAGWSSFLEGTVLIGDMVPDPDENVVLKLGTCKICGSTLALKMEVGASL
jgi:hypothetical protein